MMYYMVELTDNNDGYVNSILVEEKNLVNFISNYDKDLYKLVNVYGLGVINLEFKDFLKKENNLEQG